VFHVWLWRRLHPRALGGEPSGPRGAEHHNPEPSSSRQSRAPAFLQGDPAKCAPHFDQTGVCTLLGPRPASHRCEQPLQTRRRGPPSPPRQCLEPNSRLPRCPFWPLLPAALASRSICVLTADMADKSGQRYAAAKGIASAHFTRRPRWLPSSSSAGSAQHDSERCAEPEDAPQHSLAAGLLSYIHIFVYTSSQRALPRWCEWPLMELAG
jgi:hypothetical protein